MTIRDEILARVDALPPELQNKVLVYVSSLASEITGTRGTALQSLSGSLDAESARQMVQAIEEDCERVDAGQW